MKVHELVDHVFKVLEHAQVYCGHGTATWEDEAVALVFQTLRLPSSENEDEGVWDLPVSGEEQARVLAILGRRIQTRVPLPYLVNEAYFMGLPFYVDPRVLIPRSALAEWIERGFSPWVNPKKVRQVLDIGTGSGCLAIAMARVFQEAFVDAVDISREALEVARTNVERHELSDRVRLIESDLLSALPQAQYDVILSNPPYVSSEEMKAVPEEYRHEPSLALSGGEDGLSIVFRILREVEQYLSEDGILVVEVSAWGREQLDARFPEIPWIWLEFEYGEGDAFLLTHEALRRLKSQ